MYSSGAIEPISVGIEPVSSFPSIKIDKVENQRRKVRKIERICFGLKYNSKTENSCLPKYRLLSLVNTPNTVGIEPSSSFSSITIIYKMESQKNKVKSIVRIFFVSKHDSKTENSCLHMERYVSLVNKPISVGIDPISSFRSIKVI